MIYLDNAATTQHKPASVHRAVAAALRSGGNAGRGEASGYADNVLLDCRKEAAELFRARAEQVAFTFNATHALNVAINTLATEALARKRDLHPLAGKPRATALISGYEHNAVRRPLLARRGAGLGTVVVRTPLFEPEHFLWSFERALERGADFAVCTHVSNVFGYILPIERVDALCERYGVPLVIDASQSAGVVPLDLSALRATRFVCMPGHKGLYGPQGTGLLICLGDAEPLLYGGTGQDSRSESMPDYLPERVEAGTQNMHGIAGLLEGIRFVRRRTPERILEHERAFTRRLLDELRVLPRLKPYAARGMAHQTGVLSLGLREPSGKGSPEALAEALMRRGIATRAGLHCAPLAHETAGTAERGTLRISPSAFTRMSEVDALADALKRSLAEL